MPSRQVEELRAKMFDLCNEGLAISWEPSPETLHKCIKIGEQVIEVARQLQGVGDYDYDYLLPSAEALIAASKKLLEENHPPRPAQ